MHAKNFLYTPKKIYTQLQKFNVIITQDGLKIYKLNRRTKETNLNLPRSLSAVSLKACYKTDL